MHIAIDKNPTIAASLFRVLEKSCESGSLVFSMVLNLDLRSEMLKMHSLCQRLQTELVFQTTHLAVARPRLKVGVEREGYSPRLWGCLEGPCQKLVIAFAVPSAILR